MINSYSRPQLVIRQLVQKLPNNTSRTLCAFALGPQYDLFRYTKAAERAEMAGLAFEKVVSTNPADWQVVPYEGKNSRHIVDTDYVRLYGENLEGRLANLVSPSEETADLGSAVSSKPVRAKLLALDKPNRIRVTSQGLVVTLAQSGGLITGVTLVYGGLGYEPSQGSGDNYLLDVVDAAGTNAGTGGKIKVTTNAAGRVLTVATNTAGTGYSTGTVELAPVTAGANLGTAGDTDLPLQPLLYGRPVKVGDLVYSTYTDPNTGDPVTYRRTVVGLERDTAPSSVGTDEDKEDQLFSEDATSNPLDTDSGMAIANVSKPTNWNLTLNTRCLAKDWNGMVQGSNYNGRYAERYTLVVTQSGTADSDGVATARLRIRSASGGFSAEDVGAVTGEITAETVSATYVFRVKHAALGGLIINLVRPTSSTTLVAGQTFAFTINGNYDSPISDHSGSERIALNTSTTYSGPTDTRYLVKVTKGVTQAFKRAILKVATVDSGAVATVTVIDGGYGHVASQAIGDGYVLPTAYATGSGGTGFIPTLITDADGVVTSVVTTAYDAESVTAAASTDLITLTAHGLVLGQRVKFAGTAVPTGLTAGVYYYATVITANTFKVASSAALATAGTGINLTSDGTAVTMTTENVAGTSGTYVIGDLLFPEIDEDSDATTPYSGAEITISDTAGIDVIRTVTVVQDGSYIDLGTHGLQFKFTTVSGDSPADFNTGLRTGDVFYIDAVAESANGPRSILVLSGQVADVSAWTSQDLEDTLFDLDLRLLFTGAVPRKGNSAPSYTWTALNNAGGGIRITNGLSLQVTSRDTDYQWVPVQDSDYARLYSHWRGLVPAASGETIKRYDNAAAVKVAFGVEDMDNPVCYAAIKALHGAQDLRPVYVARLATNDLAGYTDVLKQAERIDGVYGIVPATLDLSVQQAVRDHVDKTSAEDWKLWRRAYLATASPGQYGLITDNGESAPIMATVTANSDGNVVVTSVGANFLTQGVRAGDLYRTSYRSNEWSETVYDTYVVDAVNSNDELVLVSGPSSPITPEVKFELWRPDTGLSQVEFVGNRAASFSNRRVVTIWSDNPVLQDANGNLVQVPEYYLAAEIAGLRSVMPQQQGLTFTELETSVTKAPTMFTKYSQEELNLAASKGVMIVTQEQEDGAVFIRHQLTTSTSSGSLYYEDSVGYNLDTMSYGFKDILQPFVGKQNATPETIDTIETQLRNYLETQRSVNLDTAVIGPALLGYSYLGKNGRILVEIDAKLRDRINIGCDLAMPLPINNITVTMFATTATNEQLAAAAA